MATGAEGLFVQHLTGYLWLIWKLHLRAMVHELFKFILGEMNRLFPSGLSCASSPKGYHPDDSSNGCTGDVSVCGSQPTLLTETLLLSDRGNRPVPYNGTKP